MQQLRYQLEDSNVRVMQAFMPLVDTAMTEGRGNGKITASEAAKQALHGLRTGKLDHFIGKAKLLMLLHRLVPSLSYQILKRA